MFSSCRFYVFLIQYRQVLFAFGTVFIILVAQQAIFVLYSVAADPEFRF